MKSDRIRGEKNLKKEYESYIFDLYGTLVDIRTDEESDKFWKNIAGIYASLGAVYKPSHLHERYLDLVHKKESEMSEKFHTDYPEIDLGEVFDELFDTPDDETATKGNFAVLTSSHIYKNIRDFSDRERAAAVEVVAENFRVLSRKKLKLYKDTLPVLNFLRKSGKKIYLLSNAQSLFTRPEIALCGLTPYFDEIFISSEQGFKKPAPEFMERLIETCDIDRDEAVMIGNDMEPDMGVAASCGIDGMFVNTFDWSHEETKMHMKNMQENTNTDYVPARILMNGKLRGIL